MLRSDEEDDDDRDKVNGYEVNGGVLQWRAAERNGLALTLAGYNWEVGRGAMSQWWAGWVEERTYGRCDFPLFLFHAREKRKFRGLSGDVRES